MSATYYVTKVDDCPVCEGRGLVQHPAWTEYWKENKHNTSFLSRADDVEWFRDHGWLEKPGYRNETDSDGVPEEEMICRECEGERIIESQVELFPVLTEFLSLSRAEERNDAMHELDAGIAIQSTKGQ
jgi:hypothetical protein